MTAPQEALQGNHLELAERLRRHVDRLAGLIGPRHVGRPGTLEAAASLIERELSESGYAVQRQPYKVHDVEVANLIAETPGTASAAGILILGAHYDTVETTPGADDNASAVAVMLEVARLLHGRQFRRTTRFAADIYPGPLSPKMGLAMCYFITIGMQQEQSGAIARGTPRELAVQPVVNRSILRYLPNSVTTFVVTKGACSCGLFHEEPEKRDEEDAIEKLRRKYKSRGWSPAKVERAISQHLASGVGKKQPCSLEPEVRSFLADLCDEVGELFVIVHWYDGDIERERIELPMGPVIPSDELRGTDLVTRADQVYRIVSYRNRLS